jgi:hypothetical protein
MELALVISLAGVITAAVAAFYLEGRIAAARSEANVQLSREASLALEAIARDLRGGKSAETLDRGIAIDDINYQVRESLLVRGHGDEHLPVAHFVRAVRVKEEDNGHTVEVELVRTLAPEREARLVRRAFVAWRVE